MARMNVARWRSWLALLAAAAVVPACNTNGTGGATGNPNLLWHNLSGGSGAPAAPTGLIWRDPNLGPISGGGGLGGDMTFETAGEIDITNGVATTNPFKGDLHPVSVSLAQDPSQETALEGDITAWYALYVRNQSTGGLGGGGLGGLGGGFGGGFNILPALNTDPKIRLEARADCENCAIQNTATPSETNTKPNSLMWRLIKCGVNPNLMNPSGFGPSMAADETTWWNANSGAIQTRAKAIQQSGYLGAGYWTLNNLKWYAAVIIDMPQGQVP